MRVTIRFIPVEDCGGDIQPVKISALIHYSSLYWEAEIKKGKVAGRHDSLNEK